NADIIGLSGLITPSLDEMVHVAHEMKRRGMKQPLLIGGATTSRMHTAVKIAPQYDNGVVHVLDASRSVTVAGSLLNNEQKPGFLNTISKEYTKLKEDFANKKTTKEYLSFADAQKNHAKIDWSGYTPPAPTFTGAKIFEGYDLAEIRKYIDWQPFFIAWEMHGKFPQILSDAIVGKEATKLYNDANQLVDKIVAEKWLAPKGVIGFWEANAVAGDTIEVKALSISPERGEPHITDPQSNITPIENKKSSIRENIRLEFLRQQIKKAAGQPNLSLADFIKPCPSPTTTQLIQDTAKVPSRGEGEKEFGYQWDDPVTYSLLKEFAVQNRSKPTQAEETLWQIVKSKKLEGYKFRRQHIIGSYIADLVCLNKRLIIEIDGLIHQLPENKEADEIRTQWLNERGFKILRVTNEKVINKTEEILELISSTLKNQPEIKENFDLSSPFVRQGADFIGAFSVTMQGIEPHIKRFEAALDDYNKIMMQALTDRFAEAFAELLHEKVRKEYWGYEKEESLTNEQLIKEEYKGIRPAPGYPACPDHTEKYKLFQLLGGEEATGIHLTESLAMYPAASVCGWYFSHPQSQYFGVGKIQRDQFEDYVKRKGMSVEEMERWLRPVME
ncbi:MAG TPA: vitamin B12 dependent-methionine synthase activation domain-containing protein, partial [Chitinophagaceae bacterium]|nr:vitamin B12 dependent-methionine synthase activation domain-containing protein [Chitinophagaceae bacterium]